MDLIIGVGIYLFLYVAFIKFIRDEEKAEANYKNIPFEDFKFTPMKKLLIMSLFFCWFLPLMLMTSKPWTDGPPY